MSFIQEALNDLSRPEYRSDTERIVKVCFEHGIILTLKQAESVWEAYSDSMAAGWMHLPDSDIELWNIIS